MDCNSRHPQPTITTKNRTETEEVVEEWNGIGKESEKGIMAAVQELVPKAVTMHKLQEQTELDPELSELKMAIDRRFFTTEERRALGNAFDLVLAVVSGLVVRGARKVVPRSLQEKVVRLAHKGHQGITKTKEYLHSRL